ncbi:MAG: alpha/beta hydrolase [Betaproteobacteria bacterium]|nr:alpha/beta hydrolase [Betaproteobacteria bacterium]
MPAVQANGLQFEYETLGNPADPPLLLIMGLGMQLVAWPDGFCRELVARGFYVIRFDNRDIGLSTPLDHLGVPNIAWEFAKYQLRVPLHAPYVIDDMANDTAALMDALAIAPAHVVGASMGGMIGQNLAARFPQKVRTLTSIMSTTGKRSLPKPTMSATAALLTAPAAKGDIEAGIKRMFKLFRTIGGRIQDSDAELWAHCERHVRRSSRTAGVARQLMAVAASGNRSKLVQTIVAPTLVIHGSDDPLLPPAHGVETARLIAGAKLSIVEGMGHDLPIALHLRLADQIAAHGRAT